MDRRKLKCYKHNIAELAALEDSLDRLNDQLSDVDVISGKVEKSSDDFPYILEHMTVRMTDPVQAAPILERIRKKKARKVLLERDIREVEDFISGLTDGLDKQIFEKCFLEGLSQEEVGEVLGYTKGRISQIISKYAKD